MGYPVQEAAMDCSVLAQKWLEMASVPNHVFFAQTLSRKGSAARAGDTEEAMRAKGKIRRC